MKINKIPEIITNVHHCVNKSTSWSNHYCNKIRLNIQQHEALHFLGKNLAPHQFLLLLLQLVGKPLREDVKDRIRDILEVENPEELYNPKSINNKKLFLKRIKQWKK